MELGNIHKQTEKSIMASTALTKRMDREPTHGPMEKATAEAGLWVSFTAKAFKPASRANKESASGKMVKDKKE